MNSQRSKEDQVMRISKSVFVTNFPDTFGYRDLWKLCESYGKVIDVFIPNRLSKAGKRFAFVRFIKVSDMERLIGNLCTLWVGRFHLHANAVRYERPPRPILPVRNSLPKPPNASGSFVNAIKEVKGLNHNSIPSFSVPTVVLDDSCLKPSNLSLHVLLEFDSMNSKLKLLDHTGVNSWFDKLQDAVIDFVSEDRIVWVDLEGIPLSLWSRETFVKIGKIYSARAKELFVWTPSIKGCNSSSCSSDDESSFDANSVHGSPQQSDDEQVIESVEERVSESSFRVSSPPLSSNLKKKKSKADEHLSEDPFGLYDLLQKPHKVVVEESDPSLSHPPGFTLEFPPQNLSNAPVSESASVPVMENEFSPKLNSKVFNDVQEISDSAIPNVASVNLSLNDDHGGSILGALEDMIRIGQSMGYDMEGCSKDIERIIGLGSKAKKEWVKELNNNHNINFLALQETKMECISHMDIKFIWGNSNYQFVASDSVGNSGGILCVWESSIFKKDNATISDNFIALYGTWLPSNTKVMFVAIYAPQSNISKRILWDYICVLISRWDGETLLMGDFNMVRTTEERFGSVFDHSGARDFNHFILSSGLVEVKMEGYSYTWSLSSAEKMSKLDRFLVSEGILSAFPSSTVVCLDRHLSDHRPILLKEMRIDFGPSPFRIYHSWFKRDDFDFMVEQAWSSFTHSDSNSLIRFKKKLQDLKKIIRGWIKDKNISLAGNKVSISEELAIIDRELDRGVVSDDLLSKRMELTRKLRDLNSLEAKDLAQKAKVSAFDPWYFVDGDWITDPLLVKDAFKEHFASRFMQPDSFRLKLKSSFPKRLSPNQVSDLDNCVTRSEIRNAVWECGENKSPGPDGFSFEFFRRYWNLIGPDFCSAVECFFTIGFLPKRCNASFIALIPKVLDAKFVLDFRPISLIGSVYKVITKIHANRLAPVISDIMSDSQSAFNANRSILDRPFILNEIIAWCKRKNKQAFIFKVDFAKAYDSVRWDYLLDVLIAFGFGPNWCKWIRGILSSAMASILVNGSPTSEFPFYCGLKQGDPLAPFLFILIMESLHISVSKAVDEGVFKGLSIQGSDPISHLFYADDVIFVREWSEVNLVNLVRILNCFYLASGLKINLHKSQVLGVGVPRVIVDQGASLIGCDVLHTPFKYLGVTVGDSMSRFSAWVSTVQKIKARLSKWKSKTLSVGGRLTLLKSVLGAVPLYTMSLYKVPKGVLLEMESIRSNFFKGGDQLDKKITWVAWDKVLSSKKKGGLGVSSLFALNRAPSFGHSFRRQARDGVEREQWLDLLSMLDTVTLSSSIVRWVYDLNGEGEFRVKDIRSSLDDLLLPSMDIATRWVKFIPIKINVFAWRARLDRLPTRHNLIKRGVTLESSMCPICNLAIEDSAHVFFQCDLAKSILRRICRWWDIVWSDVSSFADWYLWFDSIRLPSKLKLVLEGVFFIAWWHIWVFRNQSVFDVSSPIRSVIHDGIVSRSYTWCGKSSSQGYDAYQTSEEALQIFYRALSFVKMKNDLNPDEYELSEVARISIVKIIKDYSLHREEAKKDTLEEAEDKHEAEEEAKNEHAAQESQKLKEIRARQDRKNKKAKNLWTTTPKDDNYNVDDVMKKITYD
ncbi:RNA-directed DNA polymerase, eukaryota [Tanacetum coccineum]